MNNVVRMLQLIELVDSEPCRHKRRSMMQEMKELESKLNRMRGM